MSERISRGNLVYGRERVLHGPNQPALLESVHLKSASVSRRTRIDNFCAVLLYLDLAHGRGNSAGVMVQHFHDIATETASVAPSTERRILQFPFGCV